MCQRIGLPPMSTRGLGSFSLASRRRVPMPPQRITTGISARSTSLKLFILPLPIVGDDRLAASYLVTRRTQEPGEWTIDVAVLKMILKSSQSDQFSMYQLS